MTKILRQFEEYAGINKIEIITNAIKIDGVVIWKRFFVGESTFTVEFIYETTKNYPSRFEFKIWDSMRKIVYLEDPKKIKKFMETPIEEF